MILRQLHIQLIHGLLRVDHIAVGEVGKAPVIEFDRVFKVQIIFDMRVQPAVTAHYDCQEVQSLALRGRDQAVASCPGVARLDAGCTGVEIAVSAVNRLAADQGVGVVVLALGMDVCRRDVDVGDVAHHHEIVVFDGLLGDERHFVRGSLVVVGQSVRIVKVRDLAADLPCPVVHHRNEVVDAPADEGGQHIARVTGRLDH